MTTAVITIDGQLSVGGTLTSTPSTTFTVDYYISGSCTPVTPTDRDGRTWIGSQAHVTNGAGTVPIGSFATNPPGVFGGSWLTVTVTNPASSTSEFSNCVQVVVQIE